MSVALIPGMSRNLKKRFPTFIKGTTYPSVNKPIGIKYNTLPAIKIADTRLTMKLSTTNVLSNLMLSIAHNILKDKSDFRILFNPCVRW